MNKLIAVVVCVAGIALVVTEAKTFIQTNIQAPIQKCLGKKF